MLPGVGIFGTNSLAKSLVNVLKSCNFVIEAVWGRTKQASEDFAEEFGIPFSTTQVDDLLLLKQVTLVVIASPPHLQSYIAVKALGIGKHVIATPPAGPSQLEVLKMVHAARYYPSLLSIMSHGLRSVSAYSEMKELIASGYIGKPFLLEIAVHNGFGKSYFDWECDEVMGGGALSGHGSYIIDIITYLTDKSAKRVNGMVKTYVNKTPEVNGIREITSDDFCSFQMELEGGMSVSCVLNDHCLGEFSLRVMACGSEGTLTVHNLELHGKLNKNSSSECLYPESDIHDCKQEHLSDCCRVPFQCGLERAVKTIASSFSVSEEMYVWDRDQLCREETFEDALYVQTVIDAIRKSSQLKEWVNVNVLNEEPDPNPHLSSVSHRRKISAYLA